MKIKRTEDALVLEALRCVNGEIFEKIRSISFEGTISECKFQFIVSQEISEDEKETIDTILVNFDAGNMPKKLGLTLLVSKEPYSKIDHLEATLFARKEN